MAQTALIPCGTIIRAQGAASEAWYNGVRDAEIDRLTRQHADAEARWAAERKRMAEAIASTRREADRARKSNLDRLKGKTRRTQGQRIRERLKGIPAVIIGALMVYTCDFPMMDATRRELRRARRQRLRH